MKNQIISVIVFLCITLFSMNSNAQNWAWVKPFYDSVPDSWFQTKHCDNYNNYYYMGNYYDTIIFPDTAFIHSGNKNGSYKTISKYNVRGEYQKSIDIFTSDQECIFQLEMINDSEDNFYFAGQYTGNAQFHNHEIPFLDTISLYFPEVFVLKTDPDFNVIWSGIIGGAYQDDLVGFEITKNDMIVIGTEHYVGLFNYYLDQDTTTYNIRSHNIALIDNNKNLLWRKDIFGSMNADLSIGNDDIIYFTGTCYTDIIMDGDTIFNPMEEHHPSNSTFPFYMNFNEDGELLEAGFINSETYYRNTYYDEYGNYYADFKIRDTVVFHGDTIYGNEYGSNNKILAKYNSHHELQWYKYIRTVNSTSFGLAYVPIAIKNNHVYFTISANDDFYIGDSLIASPRNSKATIVELDENGNFITLVTADGDSKIRIGDIAIDNCKNIIFKATFNGDVYFGSDTIPSGNEDLYGKLNLSEPSTGFLGCDTTACESAVIKAPSEYSKYIWNGLPGINSFDVQESMEVNVSIADTNSCWIYDTIYVQIDEGFELGLISDTNMFDNDTIHVSINNGLEQYLWSNGDTTSQIQIIGNDLGIGEFLFWAKGKNGACVSIDTMILIVESNFGIEMIEKDKFLIYPNPAHDYISCKTETLEIQGYVYDIIDLKGNVILSSNIKNIKQDISLAGIKSGSYLFRIRNRENKTVLTKKIIINKS